MSSITPKSIDVFRLNFVLSTVEFFQCSMPEQKFQYFCIQLFLKYLIVLTKKIPHLFDLVWLLVDKKFRQPWFALLLKL